MELGGQLMGASLGVSLNLKWKMGMQLAGDIEEVCVYKNCVICCEILSTQFSAVEHVFDTFNT